MSKNDLIFFLGGQDLEMKTIRELLNKYAPDLYHDKNLSWGAKASAYTKEIQACLRQGKTPVLVELEYDLGLDASRIKIIDHHQGKAGKKQATSLQQVFELLDLPRELWTRWHELVAANDYGYIPAMLAIGATPAEVAKVRAADRDAQGITPAEETEVAKALQNMQKLVNGKLSIVHLSHSHTAAVVDRLEPALGGHGFQNLLVISPGEINFFGSGDYVLALDRAFPDGWYGGALPDRGFWGHQIPPPDFTAVIKFLKQEISNQQE